MFWRSLLVVLYFLFCPLCCLFFDTRTLITPLLSSSSSELHYVLLLCLYQAREVNGHVFLRDIHLAAFYGFCNCFWECSDNVVLLFSLMLRSNQEIVFPL